MLLVDESENLLKKAFDYEMLQSCPKVLRLLNFCFLSKVKFSLPDKSLRVFIVPIWLK